MALTPAAPLMDALAHRGPSGQPSTALFQNLPGCFLLLAGCHVAREGHRGLALSAARTLMAFPVSATTGVSLFSFLLPKPRRQLQPSG